jgi:hypothetical protein
MLMLGLGSADSGQLNDLGVALVELDAQLQGCNRDAACVAGTMNAAVAQHQDMVLATLPRISEKEKQIVRNYAASFGATVVQDSAGMPVFSVANTSTSTTSGIPTSLLIAAACLAGVLLLGGKK